MKKQRRKRIISLILSIVTLVSIIAVSYAWFYENKEVRVNSIDINVTDSNNLIFAPLVEGVPAVDSIWTTNYQIYNIEHPFKPISSNGKKIYAPDYQERYDIDGDTSVTYNEQVGYKELTASNANEYMFYQLFYVKTDHNIALYFESLTNVTPRDITGNLNECGFSSDAVAGAMRVLFQVFDNNNNVINSIIWIPNTQYEIKQENDDYVFDDEGVIEDSLQFINGTTMTSYDEVDTSTLTSNIFTLTNGTKIILGNITEDTYLCSLYSGITKIAIGFYLEGTDRECNSLVGNGKANLNLYFTSTY